MTRLDVGMYGYLVSRVAHAHPNGGQYDVSMALAETQRAMQKEAAKPGKDFGELVRERRRRFGLPNPPAGKVLPFRWPSSLRAFSSPEDRFNDSVEASAASGPAPEPLANGFELANLTQQSTELRMQEALEALEMAERRTAKPHEMVALEAAFLVAEAAYLAAQSKTQPEDTE